MSRLPILPKVVVCVNTAIASPFLSERISSSILRSMCIDHGNQVVGCMEKQRVKLVYADESFEFSFPELVDETGYIARGMMDDFFPCYPYKTTCNSWRHFLTWITDGTGAIYKDVCMEWILLAQKFLRQCQACRLCARKPSAVQLMKVFGPEHPGFIGERPDHMYKDDDETILEYELSPAMGGLVMEGALVKEEMEAPPGFELLPSAYEVGETSGAKDQVVCASDEPEEGLGAGAAPDSKDDRMMFDPVVMQMLSGSAPGSVSRFN